MVGPLIVSVASLISSSNRGREKEKKPETWSERPMTVFASPSRFSHITDTHTPAYTFQNNHRICVLKKSNSFVNSFLSELSLFDPIFLIDFACHTHRMPNVIMYRTVLLKYFWQILEHRVVVTCWGDTSSGMWNSPSDTPSAIIWRLSFHSLRSWNTIEDKILSYFFLIMQCYGVWGTFVSLTT